MRNFKILCLQTSVKCLDGNRRHARAENSWWKKPIILDSFRQSLLRRIALNFYCRGEIPNLKKCIERPKTQIAFQKGGVEILRKWLHKLGYAVRKRNMKWKVYERMDVVVARHKFLQDVRKYCPLGYTILYQDETWCNAHHTQQYIWMVEENSDTLITCLQYKSGFDIPSGKGTRLIVCASGGKKGFVEETNLCFVGNSKSEDYHREMNSAQFKEWLTEKVLPNKTKLSL